MIAPARFLSEDDRSQIHRPIIVGSGPVGLALSRFLASAGVASLLIEGGGEISRDDTRTDLSPEMTAAQMDGAIVGRTRQIGGGLNLWGGQLATPLQRETLRTDSDAGGWLIKAEELHDFFNVASELMGEEIALWPSAPIELEREREALSAVGLDLVATAWLRKPKMPSEVWQEIHASKLITLAHSAFVDSILVDQTSTTAMGVSAIAPDGQRCTFRGSCVILTCGTIESVRLLMLPDEGGQDQPWSKLSWLGRGFNDHLDAAVATVSPIDTFRLLNVFDPVMIAGTKYTFKAYSETRISETLALSAVGMLAMPGNLRNSIAELRMLISGLTPRMLPERSQTLTRAVLASAREVMPLAWRYLRYKRIGSVFRGQGSFRVSVEQPVRRDSRITISTRVRDRRGVPQASLHWLKGEEEGVLFLNMARKLKRWAEGIGVGKVDIDPNLLAEPAAFAAAADDGLHHAGGARMAKNSASGVVDVNLKVFNTNCLYCCGASIFPRIGFANPTLTGVALAARLGEHLIRQGLARP